MYDRRPVSAAASRPQSRQEHAVDETLQKRMDYLESLLSQDNDSRNQKLNAEVMRLRTEYSRLEFERDKLQHMLEHKDEEREKYVSTEEKLREQIYALQEKNAALLRENAGAEGNLKNELADMKMRMREQYEQDLERERRRMHAEFEERVTQQRDTILKEFNSQWDRAMELKTQELTRNLEELTDKHDRELVQLETKLHQVHVLELEKKVQESTSKYEEQIKALNDRLENASKSGKEALDQAQLVHEQETKRLFELAEAEGRKVKHTQQQLEEYKEKYDELRHETESLRASLSELSASTVSQESVSKTQQSRIEELEYQLETQKNKNSEMRQIMQQAQEERDVAHDKLIKAEIIRRKLHNEVQELKGNIRVFCRVRPPLESDATADVTQIEYPDYDFEAQKILLTGPSETAMGEKVNKLYPFSYDKVFAPSSSNVEVYEEISQLVQSALDGYNVCIFAYGQTGSGKTFTMSSNDGMIPMAVRQIFSTAESLKEKGWTYSLEGQFLEIYNDEVRDLLCTKKSPQKLEIRLDKETSGTTVPGLTAVNLDSPERVSHVIETASHNRSVAATKLNERSSRSHSVFTLRLSGSNKITGHTCQGTLNLIDLAGSERVAQSQATGDRLKEAISINKSLSALRDVMQALREGNRVVPYRNSKVSVTNGILKFNEFLLTQLTMLLQDSLKGNSKTLMFVNISPMLSSINETISSLRFAENVNKTELKK